MLKDISILAGFSIFSKSVQYFHLEWRVSTQESDVMSSESRSITTVLVHIVFVCVITKIMINVIDYC